MSWERSTAFKIISTRSTEGFTRWIIRIAQVAVAISVTVMILATTLIQGFQKEIQEKIFGFWGHIHISSVESIRPFESIPLDIEDDWIEAIKKLTLDNVPGIGSNSNQPAVSLISRVSFLPGIIQDDKAFEGIMLKGVDRGYGDGHFQRYLTEGAFPVTGGDSISRGLMISKVTAARLDLNVGSKLQLHFVLDGRQIRRKVEVSGIYNSGLDEYDRRFALVDRRMINQLLQWGDAQAGALEIHSDHLNLLEPINDYIYSEILPDRAYSETIKDRFPNIFEWLELQNINKWVILVLMGLVAGINMISMMIILILERKSMIGILKSVGATNRSIRTIFMYYAAAILFVGLTFGNFLGLGIAWLQKKTGFIKLDESNYYLSEAPIHFNGLELLLINGITLVVILLILWIPSLLVNKIQPIRVLHFQ